MMGRREDGQGQFFYAFEVDKVAPPSRVTSEPSLIHPWPPSIMQRTGLVWGCSLDGGVAAR